MSCQTQPDACNANEECILNIESGNYTCVCPQGFTTFNGVCNRKLDLYKTYCAKLDNFNQKLVFKY